MRFLMFYLILLAAWPAVQAKVFKISTEYPDGTSVLNELRQASSRIEARTSGRVTFKFYPGGVMGDAAAVMRKIRIGQLQGAFIQSGALAKAYNDSQVLNTPLLFRNFAEVDSVREVLDPEIMQGYEAAGWQTFGLVEGGFAYAMTKKPVENLTVLRKQKIWLPANDPLSEKLAKAFNINPIVLNIGDVLTALQTEAINAVVAPPVGAIALQWHSKTHYLTNAPFMYTFGVVAISQKHFLKLAKSDQLIVEEELATASRNMDIQSRKDNLAAFSALHQLGIQIVNIPPATREKIELESQAATAKLIESGEFSQAIYAEVKSILESTRNE